MTSPNAFFSRNLTDEQREMMSNFAESASTMSCTVRDGFSNLGNPIQKRDTQDGAYYACGNYDTDESEEYFDDSDDDYFE